MSRKSLPISNEIWKILKENSQQIKELRISQKETDRQMKETDRKMKETDRKMKETDQQIKELRISQKETDRQMKETDRQMKETDRKIKEIIGDFGNRWGKLGENLVKGSLAQRLRERGIEVNRVIANAKNDFAEFDIIAINGKEAVVVEVKATLDPSDVKEFSKNIRNFKAWWPDFKSKTVYGAIAFLIRSNRKAGDLAQKEGFFVIEATGDVIIQNAKGFKPKVFCA